jgi:hypothetical protein
MAGKEGKPVRGARTARLQGEADAAQQKTAADQRTTSALSVLRYGLLTRNSRAMRTIAPRRTAGAPRFGIVNRII